MRHVIDHVRHELPASLIVFLVALPLSLGIAAASGAPPLAGLTAAAVGGIVAGTLGGAPLQVSGPAAGLAVVVAGLVQEYGWRATCAITAAAGVAQILLGLTRLGRLALGLSPAVVHGMLAGIGVIIVLDQVHAVLGGAPGGSPLANLLELPGQIVGHHNDAVLVGMVTVLVLVCWPMLPVLRQLPAVLAAIAIATAMAFVLRLDVPTVRLPDDPLAGLAMPEVPHGEWTAIVMAVATIALIASVQSLLSAVAIDKLHTGPRAKLNRELIAQGAANIASGMLGGLPVAGVIVRSSANVAAGARTRASAVLHGVWIVVFALVGVSVLERIPLAALAAVLIVVGVKLVDIGHIRTTWWHREILPYVVTLGGVVLRSLVEGVLLGLAAALAIALYRLTHCTVRVAGDRVVVRGTLLFLAVGRLVRELRSIVAGREVTLELHIDFLDHAAFEAIDSWRADYERRGGTVHIEEVHDTWYARMRARRPEMRKSLPGPPSRWFAPWSHWQRAEGATPMLEGVREFERRGADLVRPFLADLAAGQRPYQLFITCADSRLVPNVITTSGPGDLFCVRNIGNLVPRYGTPSDSVGAAIEYAVSVLGVSSIAVCGHSDCGAMKATLHGHRSGQLAAWLRHVEPSVHRFRATRHWPLSAALAGHEWLGRMNVLQQLENLRTYPAVASAVAAGELRLVGLYFDIATATVAMVDPDTGDLASAAGEPLAA